MHAIARTDTAEQPIELVEVLDYLEFGKLVAEWSRDPSSRPSDMTAFMEQTRDRLNVPDRIRAVKFIQDEEGTLQIRLPHGKMLEEAIDAIKKDDADYTPPTFYLDLTATGAKDVSNEELLYMRIADYTIAQCR